MKLKQLLLAILTPFARLIRGLNGLRRVWSLARLRAAVHGGVPSSTVLLGPVEVHGTGQVSFGEGLYLYNGLYVETRGPGCIEIADRVVLSRGVHLVSFAGIRIGPGTLIGEYTSIRDANHRFGDSLSVRDSGHDASPIAVGANVWIGRGVTVLPGVCIGDNAVVGANAVVTRDVPAGAIVAGIPARPLDERRAA